MSFVVFDGKKGGQKVLKLLLQNVLNVYIRSNRTNTIYIIYINVIDKPERSD